MFARTALLSLSAPLLLVGVGAALFARQDKKADRPAAQDSKPSAEGSGMPAMPEPTKEHAFLTKRVGTFDCVLHVGGQASKGVETVRAIGGFWVVADFECNFNGRPFKGHNIMGYDQEKKVYTSHWVDAWNPIMSVSVGNLEGKNLVMEGDEFNPAGEKVRMMHITEIIDDDNSIHWMYEKSKGKEDPMLMKIEYKRRK
ncbi:MAG: DUF1579 family protein [Planctomycetes bacterium]|nr:DUF1579 family protein [Planctomycetota bacterium]